jgi:hypothetical protein
MRRFWVVLVGTLLSGCFAADKPVLHDYQVVAPFQEITFRKQGGEESPTVLTREGESYVTGAGADRMTFRLMAVEDDWFVVELGFVKDGVQQYLYVYTRADPHNHIAETYRSVAGPNDVGPGLRDCDMGVCIDDIDAYVAHMKTVIAAGEKPDTIYDITTK